MVIVGLVDDEMEKIERENMALVLFNTPRGDNIQMGKPQFPIVVRNVLNRRPMLSSFIGPNSWLLFDLLKLNESQEWLKEPCDSWHQHKAYKKISNFVQNMVCTNDGAERSMHLIDEYIDKVRDENARQDLIQCVAHWRKNVTDTRKSTLDRVLYKFM